ncbi:MAG TPA: AI-2E family transporter [Desulfobacterales bacterium]|nr:AI-2E family transporter [Desulfobacterales bacterium]HIP40105.1 AI-2E family transporter [Desulfocapsa sulfexigens]
MPKQTDEGVRFLSYLTLGLLAASLYIFSSYLHYILVATVLALCTSHGLTALVQIFERPSLPSFIRKQKLFISSTILTLFFLCLIFAPLVYFVSETYSQMQGVDLEHVKEVTMQMVDKVVSFTDSIPILHKFLDSLKAEGFSALKGVSMEALYKAVNGVASGAGGLVVQIGWILIFYFLINLNGRQILAFAARVMPTSFDHEKYLYRECTGTVAVVFYGTLFNMLAQGVTFGLLMAFLGGYNAFYLGVLAGFCSVIPIIGAALVYIPVIAFELVSQEYVHVVIILIVVWGVMGFFIDNILRIIFISYLKRIFGFEYTMNEILILLSILAGIASFGFWGLIIGPSVIALTLAAANLYSSQVHHTGFPEEAEIDEKQ